MNHSRQVVCSAGGAPLTVSELSPRLLWPAAAGGVAAAAGAGAGAGAGADSGGAITTASPALSAPLGWPLVVTMQAGDGADAVDSLSRRGWLLAAGGGCCSGSSALDVELPDSSSSVTTRLSLPPIIYRTRRVSDGMKPCHNAHAKTTYGTYIRVLCRVSVTPNKKPQAASTNDGVVKT